MSRDVDIVPGDEAVRAAGAARCRFLRKDLAERVGNEPRMVIAMIAAATAILATPALAQHWLGVLGPGNLNTVAGDTVLGAANAELGVVSGVDPIAGTITVIGRHGAVAQISSALVARDGQILRAPSVTPGSLKFASNENLATPGTILGAPRVIVVEPPQG